MKFKKSHTGLAAGFQDDFAHTQIGEHLKILRAWKRQLEKIQKACIEIVT